MSYLARLSARVHGTRTPFSVALPKGLRQSAPISRVEEATEEEDVAAPARAIRSYPIKREAAEIEDTEPVSRQEGEEEPEAQRSEPPSESPDKRPDEPIESAVSPFADRKRKKKISRW